MSGLDVTLMQAITPGSREVVRIGIGTNGSLSAVTKRLKEAGYDFMVFQHD